MNRALLIDLSPNWHLNLQIKMPKRKLRSEMGLLNTLQDCLNKMSLHDPAVAHAHSSRLGEFCENSPPKLCDYSYLNSFGRATGESGDFRACVGSNESYVSRANELSLELHAGESTAVTAVDFVVAYEFVDTLQDGAADTTKGKADSGRWSCDRVFDSASYHPRRRPLQFSTPRNSERTNHHFW